MGTRLRRVELDLDRALGDVGGKAASTTPPVVLPPSATHFEPAVAASVGSTLPGVAPSAFDPVPVLAIELALGLGQVAAVVKLLAEGATVPFVARYRKEATGGLDEVQIRTIQERSAYLRELEERRAAVLGEIAKQGKLTPALEARLRAVCTKAELEDLYLPYKPKRRTRATIARERGLEPLAERIWSQAPEGDPQAEASSFVDPSREVPDTDTALRGARDICAERVAEHADVRKRVRESMWTRGVLQVTKAPELVEQATKFDTYASFEEAVARIPSHRFLAIRRGEHEKVLRSSIELDAEGEVEAISRVVGRRPSSPWADELGKAVRDGYRRLIAMSVEVDVRVELKVQADRDAVTVFAQNLRELLLAPPFGGKPVLGVDPGQRTGCKCAVVDATGKLLEHATVYLVQGDRQLAEARTLLTRLCRTHDVRAVAVGNGTHGRETEAFVRATLDGAGLGEVLCVAVNEAGASVYSASDVAREEFPDLDLTVRGAASIGRRLQDPLAELVKIDPKSIGVGQYQHDVSPTLLERKLDDVVESCVNQVGVELNTASAPLLARVSGLGATLARRIVAHRDEQGSFSSRRALLQISGVGPRTFEQCAGFLRIRGAEHPLDASAVHPERYGLVERIAADLGVPVASLVCNAEAIARIDPRRYLGGDVGQFTLDDILSELRKPGRDPRKQFEPPKFRDDVRTLEDLRPGMKLEGVVTNVTAFGAFVDVGVHQDGLVHVSQLADRFVREPSEVAKVGDKLQITVLEVDLQRRRIALSAKSHPKVGGGASDGSETGAEGRAARGTEPATRRAGGGAAPAGKRSGAGPGKGPSAGASGPSQASGKGDFRFNPFAGLARK
jgi:uncharacterized protein